MTWWTVSRWGTTSPSSKWGTEDAYGYTRALASGFVLNKWKHWAPQARMVSDLCFLAHAVRVNNDQKMFHVSQAKSMASRYRAYWAAHHQATASGNEHS